MTPLILAAALLSSLVILYALALARAAAKPEPKP